MKRDTIFAQDKTLKVFKFNQKVADVFDEMIERSVPFYHEMQRMIGELTKAFSKKGTNIYDLGCATGITLCHLCQIFKNKEVKMVGYDNSLHMLEQARRRLREAKVLGQCRLQVADLNKPIVVRNASVVLLVLTMQFVKPSQRDRLVQQIYEALTPGGALIVVEKLLASKEKTNKIFTDFYYQLKKRNGYSELEIAKKREALEDVLTPFTLEENLSLLKRTGFQSVDIFFNWYNFCGMVAIK